MLMMHACHDQEFAMKNAEEFAIVNVLVVKNFDRDGTTSALVDAAKDTA